jgi:hypothetical protein
MNSVQEKQMIQCSKCSKFLLNFTTDVKMSFLGDDLLCEKCVSATRREIEKHYDPGALNAVLFAALVILFALVVAAILSK